MPHRKQGPDILPFPDDLFPKPLPSIREAVDEEMPFPELASGE